MPSALAQSLRAAAPALPHLLCACTHIRPAGQRRTVSAAADMKQSQGWVEMLQRPSAAEGPLQGLTFAVKDMYQIEGHTNACGNPTWKATHAPADRSAECVQQLLAAGAQLVGVTQMDELAYSLNGENVHYGTPVNAAAPDRVPGGSSSGSASVTAWGEVSFAVGSDTGGSVRIPASYQGIFGLRPTHGRIDMTHAMPLAPSFDVCGWFARDPETLRRVGTVLLEDSEPSVPLTRWLVARDAFATAPEAAAAIYTALQTDFDGVKAALGGDPQEIDVTLAAEIWGAHGAWVESHDANFGPGIRDRFLMASKIQPDAVQAAKEQQKIVRERLDSILGKDGFIALPSAPGPAPLKACAAEDLEEFRNKALALTCLAGLGGYPQVTLPIASIDGCPVGLSLLGPRNSDAALLDLAVELWAAISKPMATQGV